MRWKNVSTDRESCIETRWIFIRNHFVPQHAAVDATVAALAKLLKHINIRPPYLQERDKERKRSDQIDQIDLWIADMDIQDSTSISCQRTLILHGKREKGKDGLKCKCIAIGLVHDVQHISIDLFGQGSVLYCNVPPNGHMERCDPLRGGHTCRRLYCDVPDWMTRWRHHPTRPRNHHHHHHHHHHHCIARPHARLTDRSPVGTVRRGSHRRSSVSGSARGRCAPRSSSRRSCTGRRPRCPRNGSRWRRPYRSCVVCMNPSGLKKRHPTASHR